MQLTEDLLILLSSKKSANLWLITAQERFSAIHDRTSLSIAQENYFS